MEHKTRIRDILEPEVPAAKINQRDERQCPQLKKQTRILKKQTNTRPCLRAKTDQYQTYLISIPDFMTPIADMTMVMYDKYIGSVILTP